MSISIILNSNASGKNGLERIIMHCASSDGKKKRVGDRLLF
jgi:hypothetical protein